MVCQNVLNLKHGTVTIAILDTLSSIATLTKKRYCYPSQLKILELLDKYHGIKMSLRALNYYLAHMKSAGMIHTIRRYEKKDYRLGKRFKSTAYYILDKGFKCLKTLGDKIISALRLSRVQKIANYIYTTNRVFIKKSEGQGISAEIRQLKEGQTDLELLFDIKAFNEKLRREVIQRKRGL